MRKLVYALIALAALAMMVSLGWAAAQSVSAAPNSIGGLSLQCFGGKVRVSGSVIASLTGVSDPTFVLNMTVNDRLQPAYTKSLLASSATVRYSAPQPRGVTQVRVVYQILGNGGQEVASVARSKICVRGLH